MIGVFEDTYSFDALVKLDWPIHSSLESGSYKNYLRQKIKIGSQPGIGHIPYLKRRKVSTRRLESVLLIG